MNYRRIAVTAIVLVVALLGAWTVWVSSRPRAVTPVSLRHNGPGEIQISDSPTSTVATPSGTSTHEILGGRLQLIHDPVVAPKEIFVKVPVLMYHYIRPLTPEMDAAGKWLSVSPERFRAQMKEVAKLGYHTITPDDLADALDGTKTLPTKSVLITFDDGYRDQYTDAFPVLKELGLKATFFIISAYHVNPAYQTNEMIQELDRSGLITIAAHTRHHVGLADSKPEKQKDEIFGSKKDLEDVVGHPVTSFAYPYGNFNETVKNLVRDAGFRIAFSTLLGSVHTPTSRYEARRIRVRDDEYLEPILKKFSK